MGPPKVAIVGASAAGLIAAYNLAKNGVPVEVLEAQKDFEPLERTLIVTCAIESLIDFDFSETILNDIKNFRLISKNRKVDIPLSKADLVIERRNFLKLLYTKAQEEGVRIFLGRRVRRVDRYENFVKVTCEVDGNLEEIVADYAIMANGVQGLDFHRPCTTVGISQARVDLPKNTDKSTVHVWFDPSTTRFFYWLIPESNESAVLGVIGQSKKEAERLLITFMNKNGMRPRMWQNSEDVPLPTLKKSRVSLGDGRILLAGDSAAQVKATTVGGLVTGLKGGISASYIILRRKDSRDLLRSLEKELLIHTIVRGILDMFNETDYDLLIKIINKRLLSLFERVTRDELSKMSFKIFLSQPKLFGLLLRVFMRKIFSQWRQKGKLSRGRDVLPIDLV